MPFTNKTVRGLLVAVFLAVLGLGAAQAATFEGELLIAGEVDPLPGPFLRTAEGLSFPSGFIVTGAEGDFADAGLGFGDTGMRADFMFDTLPVSDFITIAGITTTLTSIEVFDQGDGFLTYIGLGILEADGFDDTPVQFSFSADGAGSRFAFSSTISTTITVIPVPGALVLFASGLAAFGLRRRQST